MKDLVFDQNGLIPAVIQNMETKQVLMVGWMNEEAYQKTISTQKVHFWSRSRKKLWLKGETSQNYLTLQEIYLDCDQDTLLVLVTPQGPTCHTGAVSCFYEKINLEEKK